MVPSGRPALGSSQPACWFKFGHSWRFEKAKRGAVRGKVAHCCRHNVLTGWSQRLSLNLNQGICNHRTTRDRNRNDWPLSAGLVIWMELCGVEGKTSRMRVPKNASNVPQRAKISEKIEVIIEMHLLAEAASCQRGCT